MVRKRAIRKRAISKKLIMGTRLKSKEFTIQEKLDLIAKYRQKLVAKPTKQPVRVSISGLRANILLRQLSSKKTISVEEFRTQVLNKLEEARQKGRITNIQELEILNKIAKKVEKA